MDVWILACSLRHFTLVYTTLPRYLCGPVLVVMRTKERWKCVGSKQRLVQVEKKKKKWETERRMADRERERERYATGTVSRYNLVVGTQLEWRTPILDATNEIRACTLTCSLKRSITRGPNYPWAWAAVLALSSYGSVVLGPSSFLLLLFLGLSSSFALEAVVFVPRCVCGLRLYRQTTYPRVRYLGGYKLLSTKLGCLLWAAP